MYNVPFCDGCEFAGSQDDVRQYCHRTVKDCVRLPVEEKDPLKEYTIKIRTSKHTTTQDLTDALNYLVEKVDAYDIARLSVGEVFDPTHLTVIIRRDK